LIAVVEASAVGLTVAKTLRRAGYDGPLTVIGDEDRMPFDRPPLSKQILAGTWEPAKAALQSAVDAEWLLGTRSTGLDVASRRIRGRGLEIRGPSIRGRLRLAWPEGRCAGLVSTHRGGTADEVGRRSCGCARIWRGS
jgi:NADPH-dependent 2,4-dienoyl-CoA reductase/sulfur reductase-like enzyme